MPEAEWWRSAVIYQVYPRSFADSTGDGVGDLRGITARMPALRQLGVDAIWLSPFYPSPQRDAGYDVSDHCGVDPLFGTLDDFRALEERAHEHGLKLIVDLVPNHTSAEHAWFQQAIGAPEGSPERERYIFRHGQGPDGDTPPNNWESVFGGPAWTRLTRQDGTPGQWYLHLFDSSQPDLNWDNEWVREQFRGILRFWLDLGVDGFRVDVAHGLIKAPGLPDYTPPAAAGSMGGDDDSSTAPPYWAQDGVHAIYRDWRGILNQYDGDRILVAEAWVNPLEKLALWVRSDEMHQAFNFTYLEAAWTAADLRRVIDTSLAVFGSVGAPSTWVLSNHDVVRHATRLAVTGSNPQGDGIGPNSPEQPDPVLGLRRARAATALMLALPGSSYLYQGEELGLPEVIDLPDSARQDPTFFRSHGKKYGRDGCRVPIPWEANAPAHGFNDTGESWLPQPAEWAALARDAEMEASGSTLEFYRLALRLRAKHGLGLGTLEWLPDNGADVVALQNGDMRVLANLGTSAISVPAGDIVLSSEALVDRMLPPDTTVWLA